MEKVSVLVANYGTEGTAFIDTARRSRKYNVDWVVYDRQANPFNSDIAIDHVVGDMKDVDAIVAFARKHRDNLDFVYINHEDSIIAGARDRIEEATGIPVLCPTRDYAIEGSKVRQRYMFQELCPEVNPRFEVFTPTDGRPMHHVKDRFYRWLDELECQVAIKPDKPGQGKGVGVWGDHFQTPQEAWEHFLSLYETGDMVIVEEKENCEEFSLNMISDGAKAYPVPRLVRDYKRAFQDDKGPNTGGMGAYSDTGLLPFVTENEYRQAVEYGYKIFNHLKGPGNRNTNLLGISPLYIAFAITGKGLKIFEINSRSANPEFINLLPLMEDDIIDVCLSIREGNLRPPTFRPMATAGMYLVPEPYPDEDKLDRKIDLRETYRLSENSGGKLFVYPSAMEKREDGDYALTSRTVYILGIDNDIESARHWSLRGMNTIKDSGFRYRNDVATRASIQKSVEHATALRASNRA